MTSDNYIQIADISGNHIKDYIQIADISGHHFDNNISMYKDDFYTLCMKDPKDNIGLRKKGMIVFEKQNVDLRYLYSDLARFCLSIFKNNQHNGNGSMSMIPKQPIPISEELEQYIREYISDYYGIRK